MIAADAARHSGAPAPRRQRIAPDRPPAVILFNFSVAFPPLDRSYVAQVLEAMRVSNGVRNAVLAMYAPSWTHVGRPDSSETPGFRVATGAPQGCPLSGRIFACATVALLDMLTAVVGPQNVFLFADDTAIVIDRVTQLVEVRAAFEEYRAATALVLKDEKCVLVPLLRAESDEETLAAYRRLLADEVPAWRGFRVELRATYLGVPIGAGRYARGALEQACPQVPRPRLGALSQPTLSSGRCATCPSICGASAHLRSDDLGTSGDDLPR